MSPDEKAIWNERVKLTSGAMNNVAVAVIVTGTLVPLISGAGGPIFAVGWFRAALVLTWLTLGIAIHAGALMLLGRIKG